MSDNTQNAATSQEPLLTPDDSRYVMFPIQHNDIWEMYKKSIDSFWHTGEVSGMYQTMTGRVFARTGVENIPIRTLFVLVLQDP